ncbi:MAG TPA: nucleotide sugar dehydrogenase [Tepidisphaeraceae bacterium]|jgi:UDP-N-acetyl-D-glucosamine dehydrogenase
MDLRTRITTGDLTVGVIGLGYVGLPLAGVFCGAGCKVIGFDIDPAKIAAIERGENYLKHLGEDLVKKMLADGRFAATCDMGQLKQCDAILCCVPTPLGEHLEPDLSYIERTASDIAKTLRRGQLIVLESSTYPGTTRQVMLPVFEKMGLKLGSDFFLAYSPEREDPGRKDFTTQTIPKLVGGCDAASGELAHALYSKAIKQVILVASAEIAEAAKILENTYRAVNIALVNEMKVILDAMGIDIWQVIAAAATKPFGFQPFYPGPGLGGHCIPIDPYYLAWKARELGQVSRFIELAGEINRAMPEFVVHKTTLALNSASKSVRGSRILILGLAYKPDVDDVRESPSFELIEKLTELGAIVDYHDPLVLTTHKGRRYDFQMRSVDLTAANLKTYDCVIIATAHSGIDWKMISENAQLIVDTRNALQHSRGQNTVIKA